MAIPTIAPALTLGCLFASSTNPSRTYVFPIRGATSIGLSAALNCTPTIFGNVVTFTLPTTYVSGEFSFTIFASNADGLPITQIVSGNYSNIQTGNYFAITSANAATAVLGSAFSYAITVSRIGGGSTSGAFFNAQGLPAGLSVNSDTGEISGTPSEAGYFPVVLMTACSAVGPYFSRYLELQINLPDGLSLITSPTTSTVVAGNQWTYVPTASIPLPSQVWTLAAAPQGFQTTAVGLFNSTQTTSFVGTFSAPGVYVVRIRLLDFDTQVTVEQDVTVTVLPAQAGVNATDVGVDVTFDVISRQVSADNATSGASIDWLFYAKYNDDILINLRFRKNGLALDLPVTDLKAQIKQAGDETVADISDAWQKIGTDAATRYQLHLKLDGDTILNALDDAETDLEAAITAQAEIQVICTAAWPPGVGTIVLTSQTFGIRAVRPLP